MSALKNLIGLKFGRLTVLLENGRTIHRKVLWSCMCDCGNIINVTSGHLNSGNTTSCGCLRIESITSHGCSYMPEYHIWQQIIQRCNNTNNEWYSSYGGRGITVCNRWLDSFENFYSDMGPKPTPDHSIDRTENDGNYEPNNCRWATDLEQQNNKRNTVIIGYKGKNYTISEICEKFNVYRVTFRTRLDRGWSVEEAIETPVGNYK